MKIYKIITVLLFLFTVNGLYSQVGWSWFSQFENVMYVNALEGLRMRSSPSINGERIRLLPHFAVVTLVEEANDFVTIDNIRGKWVRVKTSLDILSGSEGGWVFNGYLIDETEFINYINNIPFEQISYQANITQKFIGGWTINDFMEGYSLKSNGRYSWGREASGNSEEGTWHIEGSEIFFKGIMSDESESWERSTVFRFNFIGDNILILTSSDQGKILRYIYFRWEFYR